MVVNDLAKIIASGEESDENFMSLSQEIDVLSRIVTALWTLKSKHALPG